MNDVAINDFVARSNPLHEIWVRPMNEPQRGRQAKAPGGVLLRNPGDKCVNIQKTSGAVCGKYRQESEVWWTESTGGTHIL